MLSDQIIYFIIVIGVLVTVHEFGHFLAARLCRMRTDVFSVGFGTRLLGFNKRTGFTFGENAPNKIAFTMEQGHGVGGSARHLSDADTQKLIGQIATDILAKSGAQVVEISHQILSDYPEKISADIVMERSLPKPQLEQLAEEIRSSVTVVLHSIGIVVQRMEAAFTFDGAGMCDYRLSLLPLGGYVKIAGMVDESMDNSFANKPPQPWEFRAHPTWQKIIVICAGVTMNIVLAGALYSWLSYSRGEEVMLTRTVGSVAPQSMAERIGFRAGDEIESVNGAEVHSWNGALSKTFLAAIQKNVDIRLRRGGTDTDVVIPYGQITARSDSLIQDFGLYPAGVSPVVHDVIGGTPAERAGVQANDVVLAVDSMKMATDVQLMAAIHAHTGKQMSLDVKRADGEHRLVVAPDNEGHIGIHIINDYQGPRDTIHYTIPQAVSAGVSSVGMNFSALGNLLWKLVTGQASVKQNLAGPIAIAKMAGKTAEEGVGYLLALMATLSISLAGLNILPVPALDGGHLVFILIEGAIRREVSNKVKIAFQQVGFALLLALMIFIVFNDLSR